MSNNSKSYSLEQIEAAILKTPKDHHLWHYKGLLHQKQQDAPQAAHALLHALELNPDAHESAWCLAYLLDDCNKPKDAANILKQLYERNPSYPGILNALAHKLTNAGDVKMAEKALIKQTNANPMDSNSWNLLGTLQRARGDFAQAMYSYQQAYINDHESYVPSLNIIELQMASKNLDQANIECDKAIQKFPDVATLHFCKAMIALHTQDFNHAWQLYESRLQIEPLQQKYKHWNSTLKCWDGNHQFEGGLIIMAEQGLGDLMHFLRFLPLLQQLLHHLNIHAKIYIETQLSLQSLLTENTLLAPYEYFVLQDQQNPSDAISGTASYFLPLLSIPSILYKHQILPIKPSNLAYSFPTKPWISIDKKHSQHWGAKIQKPPHKRLIGISWTGRTKASQIPATELELFNHLDDVQWISLQKFIHTKATYPKINHLTILKNGLSDFLQTAGIMTSLDTIICNDSALAHLAGAMGLECHVILPFTYDWRWKDDQWYPTIHRYYSPTINDWKTPINQIIKRLQ